MPAAESSKSEATARKILDCALELFRSQGFDGATMRDIAGAAHVATGAAYYYYPSKEAIVMAFYERASAEMRPQMEAALVTSGGLEARLTELIRAKLAYFAPHRGVLRALLRNGADPRHPLSPFSAETKHIREADVVWFRACLDGGGVRVPRDLDPHMPEVLWMFQMGVILFWAIDDSAEQVRTARLLRLGSRLVSSLLRISSLPLTRPLRKVALELIEIVKGE